MVGTKTLVLVSGSAFFQLFFNWLPKAKENNKKKKRKRKKEVKMEFTHAYCHEGLATASLHPNVIAEFLSFSY